MSMKKKPLALLFPAGLALASCSVEANVDSSADRSADGADVDNYTIEEVASFDEPWAAAFLPGTQMLVITEKAGAIKAIDTATGETLPVSGAPEVDYGGQGGLGDVAFLTSEAGDASQERSIYLSWAEAGNGDTRGAVVGKGTFACSETACAISDLEIVWQQAPKVTGRGHYSHRIRFSPDEAHMFVASGDRQKLDPAQDNSNTIGTIVRLNLDGSAAAGNPMADQPSPTNEIWSYGHRNILGMDWDAQGRLWDMEHGPAGGDELNLVAAGANYGWPTRSNGNHYSGDPIDDHSEDDGFTKPAIHWTPVIAPGDMIFYSGDMFAAWQGDALIASLAEPGLIRIEIDGDSATEAQRYPFENRIRSVDQGPDGALWLLEDGEGGRLMKLSSEE
ncbi:MAG: PQQ-dependent sugar dehydrogenase [Erythrobacter sp.]